MNRHRLFLGTLVLAALMGLMLMISPGVAYVYKTIVRHPASGLTIKDGGCLYRYDDEGYRRLLRCEPIPRRGIK